MLRREITALHAKMVLTMTVNMNVLMQVKVD